MPHHVTQRGNRRQATFFCDDDYQACLDLMAEWCGEHYHQRGTGHLYQGCFKGLPVAEDGMRRITRALG